MTKLSVNLNKVATLRNTRTIGIPSVSRAARICLDAGAHGITLHPRPDGRHVRAGDIHEIGTLLRGFPDAEFNIEGNPFQTYMGYAHAERPTQCTLVPDEPDAPTSNQGWNLRRDGERLRLVIAQLKQYGCRVSLFMEAGSSDIGIAAEIGADRIELYTEPFAAAFAAGEFRDCLDRFAATASEAASAGLGVNAGHDLSLDNIATFLAAVPNVLEVSIGHALIADALEMGLSRTVARYLDAIASVN